MTPSETVARANAFVLFDLSPTPLRLWGGVGVTSWDGAEWVGTGRTAWDGENWVYAGSLGSIDGIGGARGLVAERVVYRIGGLSLGLSDQVAALSAARRKRVTLWAVVFNEDGGEIARAVVHKGRIDAPSITRTESTLSFEIPVETAFVGANRIPWNLYTDTDQRQLFSGDRAFEFISTLNGKRIVWP
jgi:hypothetical protein